MGITISKHRRVRERRRTFTGRLFEKYLFEDTVLESD